MVDVVRDVEYVGVLSTAVFSDNDIGERRERNWSRPRSGKLLLVPAPKLPSRRRGQETYSSNTKVA